MFGEKYEIESDLHFPNVPCYGICHDNCFYCNLREFTLVSHPGGDSYHQVEKSYCTLDYWEEDF